MRPIGKVIFKDEDGIWDNLTNGSSYPVYTVSYHQSNEVHMFLITDNSGEFMTLPEAFFRRVTKLEEELG